MSNADSFFTKALPAEEVVEKMAAVAADVFRAEGASFQLQTNVRGLNVSLNLPATQIAGHTVVVELLTRVKGRRHVLATSATVHHQNNGNLQVQYQCDDGVIGRIMVVMQGEPERAMRALESVEKHFKVTPYVDLVRGSSPVVDQSAIALRERSVADLQEEVQRLATFLSGLTQREAEDRRKLQAEMDSAHQGRTNDLEKEYRDRQASLDSKKQSDEDAIAKKEKDFQERVSQFETRESKYMRRELLKQIKDTLAEAERMAPSGPTGKKRIWVHLFAWALLIASGTLAGMMASKVYDSPSADWHHLAPLSAGFLTFVCTMVYYLKWNDRWFREHADAEFAAKRYKADILRASWVAELVQEWAKEGKGDLPPDLVAAYTKNLFRDVVASRVSEHPMDDLGNIIKRATRVDIGKGVFSIRGASGTQKQGKA
jgi:hypothetical protein